MAKSSLDFKSVKELSSLIKSKELSPVELLDYHISRIDALEGKLNTFASIDIDEAKLLAKASEARAAKGELLSDIDGIPTSIKDLIAQKGHPQRFGSKTTPDTKLEIDAPSVERLRNAGAVLLGKSTTSEFGCKAVGDSPLTGITRNPWNLEKLQEDQVVVPPHKLHQECYHLQLELMGVVQLEYQHH